MKSVIAYDDHRKLKEALYAGVIAGCLQQREKKPVQRDLTFDATDFFYDAGLTIGHGIVKGHFNVPTD